MKFSELLENFVCGLIEGEPESSAWCSIADNAAARKNYQERMAYLRSEIDAVVARIDGDKQGAQGGGAPDDPPQAD